MQAVIIAAGESSRFWPLNKGIHKSQFFLLGKPLLYWTLKGLVENNIRDIVVVCAQDSSIPAMREEWSDLNISLSFKIQEKPLGTGNALWQARDLITEPFFVVWPHKVTSRELARKVIEKQKQEGGEVVLVGAETPTPWDYGMARMEGERVAEIVENPLPGTESSSVKIIGFYFFQPDFFQYYEKLPHHHEADFIEAINLYLKNKKAPLVKIEEDVPALKYPWELFGILDFLFRSENFKPAISPSAQIEEGVIIKGQVHIGKNTRIQDNTILEGPCFIGDNCVIGHGNVLRGPLDIEDEVMTGAFCEIKHSVIQRDTHFHSGYIGDSVVGRDCRFGAGFITANRRFDRGLIPSLVKGKKIDTGLTYFGAVVGDGTSFGIHSGTMPGVLVGSDCIVGPGTQVFRNVSDGTTLFTKFK